VNVLYVASEAIPFIKTGGLADVAGSLPKILQKDGIDVRIVLPLYGSIKDKYEKEMHFETSFIVELGWRKQYVGVLSYTYEGITYYFLDNEYYFKRPELYGYYDDGERFAWFCKAVTLLGKYIHFKPDIIHANDWHTGPVCLYVKDFAKGDVYYQNIQTIFTIHNLKYQGIFHKDMLEDVMGLSTYYFHEEGVKFYECINFLKAGIVYCDRLTTVSKSYAEEIQYTFFGEQMEGIIQKHRAKLSGILNGIDQEVYNPQTDSFLAQTYGRDSLHRKKENKRALQDKFKLPVKEDVPIIAMVTRLTGMKGLDLVQHIFEELLQEDIQFVILGTGDAPYENLFKHFAYQYPNKVVARLHFNEGEAHEIYAGADLFLMPSMFEPCGLGQMIALRYGAIPIVREVGGLRDTVQAYNEYTKEGNGFTFAHYNAHDLLHTIKRALWFYTQKEHWQGLVKTAMSCSYDWSQSSKQYKNLYEEVCTPLLC
jgi:starch synthase